MGVGEVVTNLSDLITILTIVCSGLGALLWKVNNYFRTLNGRISLIEESLKHLEEFRPYLKIIEEKFTPNGGSSLEDAIRKTKDDVISIKKEVSITSQRTRVVWSALSDGVFECNSSGEWIWFNSSLCELFGQDFTTMLKRGWLSSVVSSERAKVWEDWISCIQKGIPYEAIYSIYNKKTKKTYRVSAMMMAQFGEEANPISYLGTIKKLNDARSE